MTEFEKVMAKIEAQRGEIAASMEDASHGRGLAQDIFKAVLPIFSEQLDIMEETLKFASSTDSSSED